MFVMVSLLLALPPTSYVVYAFLFSPFVLHALALRVCFVLLYPGRCGTCSVLVRVPTSRLELLKALFVHTAVFRFLKRVINETHRMFHSDILCFPDWFLDILMSENCHKRTYLENVPTKVVTVRKYQLPLSHVEKPMFREQFICVAL
jgi:hypothetical protein